MISVKVKERFEENPREAAELIAEYLCRVIGPDEFQQCPEGYDSPYDRTPPDLLEAVNQGVGMYFEGLLGRDPEDIPFTNLTLDQIQEVLDNLYRSFDFVPFNIHGVYDIPCLPDEEE